MDDDDAIADQNMTVTDVNAIVTKANEIEIDSTQKTLIYKAKNLSLLDDDVLYVLYIYSSATTR